MWLIINDGLAISAIALLIASVWLLSEEYRSEDERKHGCNVAFLGIVFASCWIFSTLIMYLKNGMGW